MLNADSLVALSKENDQYLSFAGGLDTRASSVTIFTLVFVIAYGLE